MLELLESNSLHYYHRLLNLDSHYWNHYVLNWIFAVDSKNTVVDHFVN